MAQTLSLRPSQVASRIGRPVIACLLLVGSSAAGARLAQIDFEPDRAESSETPPSESPPSAEVATVHALAPELAPQREHGTDVAQAAWPPQPLALLVDPWPEAVTASSIKDAARPLSATSQKPDHWKSHHLEVTSVDEFEDPWQSAKPRPASQPTAPESGEIWLD